MDISIMIEGQMGLDWDRWKRIVALVEDLGFAGLYRSDHFTNPDSGHQDSLELVVSLAYVADHTERIRFGQLVSPVSFRDPVMLARQAAHLDLLSGGRHVLGLGAGWQDREHDSFGYELGDVRTRLDRLEEGLEVATRLLRPEGPVSFEGRHFRLLDAEIHPHPPTPTRICVGGGGMKRTLPLAARYADVWNAGFGDEEQFTQRNAIIDRVATEHGRDPASIRRTVMTGCFFAPDPDILDRRLAPIRQNPNLADKSPDEIVDVLNERGMVAGGAEEAADSLRRLSEAGVQEVMLQWLDLEDIDGLRELADALLA